MRIRWRFPVAYATAPLPHSKWFPALLVFLVFFSPRHVRLFVELMAHLQLSLSFFPPPSDAPAIPSPPAYGFRFFDGFLHHHPV